MDAGVSMVLQDATFYVGLESERYLALQCANIIL